MVVIIMFTARAAVVSGFGLIVTVAIARLRSDAVGWPFRSFVLILLGTGDERRCVVGAVSVEGI